MKNKKIIISIAIFITFAIIIPTVFFIKNNYKTIEFGNNNIKSADDIKEYILNISSYEADISLEIKSNKNENKYRIIQKYASPNIFKQEVVEPNNIKGLITTYDGVNLKIENSSLNLSKIYQDYSYISENSLCLCDFIESYKSNSNSICKEEANIVILETKITESTNKYSACKKLYIDKVTLKPIKMEIKDVNKKMLVYILYNEIKINSINKEEVLAFEQNILKENI